LLCARYWFSDDGRHDSQVNSDKKLFQLEFQLIFSWTILPQLELINQLVPITWFTILWFCFNCFLYWPFSHVYRLLLIFAEKSKSSHSTTIAIVVPTVVVVLVLLTLIICICLRRNRRRHSMAGSNREGIYSNFLF
jgi:hypothetical protein